MARPWLPVGWLPVVPSEAVPGAFELDTTISPGTARPGVWLVLLPGRQYLLGEENSVWVLSVR